MIGDREPERRISQIGRWRVLFAYTDCLEDDVAYALRHLDGISVHWEDLPRLEGALQHLRALTIQTDDGADLSILSKAERLEMLAFGRGRPVAGDLRHLHGLEYLSCNWSRNVLLPDRMPALRTLELRGYSPSSGRLDVTAPMLQQVTITEGRLESIEGLGACSGLEGVSLSYLPKLTAIEDLRNCDGLLSLEIDHCKHAATELGWVQRCTRLERLAVLDCGQTASIGFIQALPRLKHFVVAGTKILDNDTSVVLGRSLDHVYFDGKRTYSHTLRQVLKSMRQDRNAYDSA